MGDDGSGAIMGRAVVRRALLALDGMAPWSGALEAVIAALGRDQTVITNWARTARPADYAQFAPLLLVAAAAGDAHAAEIVREAAGALADHARRLQAMGAPKLSLLGGLAEPMMAQLPSDVHGLFVQPQADAVDGAILLAKRGLQVTEPFANGVSRA